MAFRMRLWGLPLLAISGLFGGIVLRAADDDDRAPPPLALGASVAVPRDQVRDLTLTIAPELPCVWPAGMTPMAVIPTATFGRSGRHRDMLVIDEHTGTQWDAPAHFVPPPDSGLPGAGPMGLVTGEKVPVWQFCGEACVIDVRQGRDSAENGSSVLVGPEVVREWEMTHRRLGPGDVVLFRSDYTDDFYKPFPEGERFVAAALRKEAPGWPAPTAATMDYLADRGVMTLGSGGECRCVAITEPTLAAELVARARARRVVDLSVTLDEDLPVVWPGRGPGEEGGRYVSKVLNKFGAARGPFFALTHLFDSMAGTHLVLPSFSLPANRAELEAAEPAVLARIAAHEARYGALPAATVRTESAELSQLMGPAHVVDVRGMRGAGAFDADKPAGPVINRAFLEEHEATRPFLPGEVVVFWSGYSDDRFRPLPAAPEKDAMFVAPLAGEAEGWPQPTPEAILWLAKRGIRCLGTDGPTLGGVDAAESHSIDWAAATAEMAVIEYLTNVGAIADKDAFFLFAPVKIAGTRGGYGRAIALVGD